MAQILTRHNKVIAYNNQPFVPVGNSAVCMATDEHYDDVTIVSVESIPTDIDNYNYYYINGKFVKESAKCKLSEENYDFDVTYGAYNTVGKLHCCIRGGTIHLYGDLRLSLSYLGTTESDWNLLIRGGYAQLFAPASTLYFPQLADRVLTNGDISRSVAHVTLNSSGVSVLNLPMTSTTDHCVVHINTMYNISGVVGIV